MQVNNKYIKNGYFKRGKEYEWYLDGKLHNEDGPAVRKPNGDLEWWIHGELHREEGPALEYRNGDKEWYLNGLRHRDNGPAVALVCGIKQWWINDKLHREDGPAYEGNGEKTMFGDGADEWWIDGVQLTQEEFNHWRMKQDLNAKLHFTLATRFKEKLVKI
jgi:hypothetical protein